MAISRDLIIRKVKQAIKQLPSNGLVVREIFDKRNELAGFMRVSQFEGVLYSNDSNGNKNVTIELADKGKIMYDMRKNFLIIYDLGSAKVKTNDYIIIDSKCYLICDLGENLNIFQVLKLEESKKIKLEHEKIQINGRIYALYDYTDYTDSGYNL